MQGDEARPTHHIVCIPRSCARCGSATGAVDVSLVRQIACVYPLRTIKFVLVFLLSRFPCRKSLRGEQSNAYRICHEAATTVCDSFVLRLAELARPVASFTALLSSLLLLRRIVCETELWVFVQGRSQGVIYLRAPVAVIWAFQVYHSFSDGAPFEIFRFIGPVWFVLH